MGTLNWITGCLALIGILNDFFVCDLYFGLDFGGDVRVGKLQEIILILEISLEVVNVAVCVMFVFGLDVSDTESMKLLLLRGQQLQKQLHT